jgi:tRNA threonylcarbamoyladenosine biosynthesis protein TsaB
VVILGIETSASQVSVAVGDGTTVRAAFSSERGPRHAETLAPAIATVLDAAGLRPDDLDAVAVSQGPGLFTGLRVGIATAQALALACRVPLVGVPTLDVVAEAARLTERRIVAVTDARRGEVFFACFRGAPPGRPRRCGPDRVATPALLVEELSSAAEPVVLVGRGIAAHGDVFDRFVEGAGPRAVQVLADPSTVPHATTVIQLALSELAGTGEHPPASSAALRPIYVRRPDAEARWPQRPAAAPAGEPALEAAP